MTVIDSLVARLPGPLRRLATPARVQTALSLARFSTVGVIGFAVDAATVYATRTDVGLIWAGMAGFLVAVNVNFILNRAWTFRDRRAFTIGRQWRSYVGANIAGFAVNRGIYVALIETVPLAAAIPIVPLFLGALGGLILNFSISHRIAFR